jgi:hypothetical protein
VPELDLAGSEKRYAMSIAFTETPFTTERRYTMTDTTDIAVSAGVDRSGQRLF